MVDWDDPASRARHIERVGPEAYNRDLAEHTRRSVVATVAGRDIRPVRSRFGRLFMVDGLGRAFPKQEDAEAFARENPAP